MTEDHKIVTVNSSELPSIDKIIDLLSLVFPNSNHTVDSFKWKHIENPYGPSIITYALHNNKVIGVRPLWKCNLIYNGAMYSGYQPCDTVVHPDYRGKGIFTKMTIQALNFAVDAGADIIFNFPNNQSAPGYKKLGWTQLDNLNRYILPINIFRNIKGYLAKDIFKRYEHVNIESNIFNFKIKNNSLPGYINLYTDERYYKWRIGSGINKNYGMINSNGNSMIYRKGKRGLLNEVEIVYDNIRGKSCYNLVIKKLIEKEKPDYISIIILNDKLFSKRFFKVPNQIKFYGNIINPNLNNVKFNFQPLMMDTI
jgi:GNAT superfamily N-acetyltransferase